MRACANGGPRSAVRKTRHETVLIWQFSTRGPSDEAG